MTTTPTPPNYPADVPSWLRGKTIEDLAAIEVAGRVLIPENLRRRGPKGEEVLVPVMMRVPTETERGLARIQAIAFVADLRKRANMPFKIETVEDAQKAVGADVFENFDSFAILAQSLFEPTPPHGRAYLLDILIGTFDPSTLFDAYMRLDFYSRLYNPRLEQLTEEQFWFMVAEVARVRNLGPLAVISGSAQNAFTLRTTLELSRLRRLSFYSPSSETSTPES